MPRKPATPCSYPNCPKLTHSRFCVEHAKIAERNYRKYERKPEIDKRYGREWRKVRARYVAEHPLCEQCQKDGQLTPTQEVHHILPLSKGGTREFDNLMALCKPCHSRISALDGDRWRTSRSTKRDDLNR